MVNATLRETAREAFFFASLRHFKFLGYETKTTRCFKRKHKTSLHSLLASFIELAGTGNSIITHYVMIRDP